MRFFIKLNKSSQLKFICILNFQLFSTIFHPHNFPWYSLYTPKAGPVRITMGRSVSSLPQTPLWCYQFVYRYRPVIDGIKRSSHQPNRSYIICNRLLHITFFCIWPIYSYRVVLKFIKKCIRYCIYHRAKLTNRYTGI